VRPDLATPSGDLPLADELSAVFARMSGLLLSEDTVATALGLITSLAMETVPGSTGAGMTLVDDDGRRTSSAATDPRVESADALQYELDEGPCLAALAARQVMRSDDVGAEPRWPRWAVAASALGVWSCLSAPLVAGDRAVGAIKVYADQPGVFAAHDEQLLTMFAAQATILVVNVQAHERAQRLSDGMRKAVRSRDVVSMAKGVLMARHGVDEDTAFGMLVALRGEGGAPLREAAQTVVQGAVRQRR
jgi:GAF domain-containing protein